MNLFLLCKIQERETRFWDLPELGGQIILFDGVTKRKGSRFKPNISQKSIGTNTQPTKRLSTSSKLKRDKFSTSYIKKELKYIKFLQSSTFAISLSDSQVPWQASQLPHILSPALLHVCHLSINLSLSIWIKCNLYSKTYLSSAY